MANFQNIIPKQLAQIAVPTSYTVAYTVPVALPNSATGVTSITTRLTRTYIKDMNICNTTGAAINIYVSIVENGASPGAANALYFNTPIPANTVVRWTGAQIMPESTANSLTTLQVMASAVGITLTISGGEAT